MYFILFTIIGFLLMGAFLLRKEKKFNFETISHFKLSLYVFSYIFLLGVCISNFIYFINEYGIDFFSYFAYPESIFIELGINLVFYIFLVLYPFWDLFKNKKYFIPLALTNLLFIFICLIAGTVILQHETLPYYDYDFHLYKNFFSIVTEIIFFFDLHRIYHSTFWSYFLFTLVIQLVFLLRNRLSSFQFRLDKIGFFLVHISIILFLLSFFMHSVFTISGTTFLNLNEGTNVIRGFFFKGKNKIEETIYKLPFRVSLEDFKMEYWQDYYRIKLLRIAEEFSQKSTLNDKSKSVAYHFLETGKVKHINGSDFSYRLKEFHPYYTKLKWAIPEYFDWKEVLKYLKTEVDSEKKKQFLAILSEFYYMKDDYGFVKKKFLSSKGDFTKKQELLPYFFDSFYKENSKKRSDFLGLDLKIYFMTHAKENLRKYFLPYDIFNTQNQYVILPFELRGEDFYIGFYFSDNFQKSLKKEANFFLEEGEDLFYIFFKNPKNQGFYRIDFSSKKEEKILNKNHNEYYLKVLDKNILNRNTNFKEFEAIKRLLMKKNAYISFFLKRDSTVLGPFIFFKDLKLFSIWNEIEKQRIYNSTAIELAFIKKQKILQTFYHKKNTLKIYWEDYKINEQDFSKEKLVKLNNNLNIYLYLDYLAREEDKSTPMYLGVLALPFFLTASMLDKWKSYAISFMEEEDFNQLIHFFYKKDIRLGSYIPIEKHFFNFFLRKKKEKQYEKFFHYWLDKNFLKIETFLAEMEIFEKNKLIKTIFLNEKNNSYQLDNLSQISIESFSKNYVRNWHASIKLSNFTKNDSLEKKEMYSDIYLNKPFFYANYEFYPVAYDWERKEFGILIKYPRYKLLIYFSLLLFFIGLIGLIFFKKRGFYN